MPLCYGILAIFVFRMIWSVLFSSDDEDYFEPR
jgi:hypothetical protein